MENTTNIDINFCVRNDGKVTSAILDVDGQTHCTWDLRYDEQTRALTLVLSRKTVVKELEDSDMYRVSNSLVTEELAQWQMMQCKIEEQYNNINSLSHIVVQHSDFSKMFENL